MSRANPPPASVFPAWCVQAMHATPPVSLRAAPRLVEALEAAYRRSQQDENACAHNAISVQELLALQTVDVVQRHEAHAWLVALYSVLRPFIVA